MAVTAAPRTAHRPPPHGALDSGARHRKDVAVARHVSRTGPPSDRTGGTTGAPAAGSPARVEERVP